MLYEVITIAATALLTGSALVATLPAQAFWGPFDWFDDDYYDGPYGPYGYYPPYSYNFV